VPTKSLIKAQKGYSEILEEIKLRIDAVNQCTSGLAGLAPPFVKDFFFLQVRMICELIALGCLLAHGDIEQTQTPNLQKEWSADRIMKALEELHPHFFPVRLLQTRTADGWHFQKASGIGKAEVLKLYGRCGGMLHRGNVRKLLKGPLPRQVHYPDLIALAQPIIDLLTTHAMAMKDGEHMLIATLSNADLGGACQVAIAETPPGEKFSYDSPYFLSDPPQTAIG
jgi:hypothetical protein